MKLPKADSVVIDDFKYLVVFSQKNPNAPGYSLRCTTCLYADMLIFWDKSK